MQPHNKAHKQNPALLPFSVLVGEWKTEGTHPYVTDKILHGQATFEWICGGAFLLMRSEINDDPRFPDGIAILGSDDTTGKYFMIYFDERNVSRKQDVTLKDNVFTWERMTPEFSQRMVLTIQDGDNTIVSKGEMSINGGPWESDLCLTYTRIK